MQFETLQDVPQEQTKGFLRIASIASKAAMRFFYVGSDARCIHLLTSSFQDGETAGDLDEAKKVIKENNIPFIDAVIIDIPYNESELKGFHFFLKNHGLESTPVIYNKKQLKDAVACLQFVDDAIDLSNWQFDFYTKVTFLKKFKQQTAIIKKSRTRIKPECSLAKRALDILAASIMLLILSPLLLLIALAIKLESKGPVFYIANRAGRGFKIFKFYKFRTMEVNADKKIEALAHLNQYQGAAVGARFFKISNDPRITKVGRFLRNTSLDEIPQLLNVIRGDMSLVGNRPLPLYEAATLTTNQFVERFMAPAGITGLWQIKKRGRSEMSVDERLELDISYARKASLIYDFLIMAKTPAALLQKSDV